MSIPFVENINDSRRSAASPSRQEEAVTPEPHDGTYPTLKNDPALLTMSSSCASVPSHIQQGASTVVCACPSSGGRIRSIIASEDCISILKNASTLEGRREPVGFWEFVDRCHKISDGAFTISKIFALYLLIILLFGFVYVYTAPSSLARSFNVTILDSSDEYLLSVSYQKLDQIVVLSSTQPKDFMETMFDLQQGLVGHRDSVKKRCYIRSSLTSQFIDEHQQIQKLLWSRSVVWERPADPIHMLILRRRVQAEVVQSIAGQQLAHFCDSYKTHWLVSYAPSSQAEDVDPRRTISPPSKLTVITSSFYLVLLHHSRPL